MKKETLNKLAFQKATIVELSEVLLEKVNGGTGATLSPMTIHTISCSFCISSSNGNYTQY